MASIRQMAMQHIGRRVVVHSTYGIHDGILHHVDDRGMYLMRTRRGTLASAHTGTDASLLMDGAKQMDAEQVWWPLFFIPWFAAFALWPWGLWW